MLKLCRLSTSVVRTVWTVVGLALLSGSSYADTITHVYYTLDGNPGTLNVVGFNGTNFVGGVTELEPLIPNWGAMSYDADAGLMYYTLAGDADNAGTLNVVGFNGTNFVGGVTQLEFLVPDWTAMSYDADAGLMYYALAGDADNAGTLNVIGFNGTNFVGGYTPLEPLVPDWNAMSLAFAPEVIPEPSLLALFGVGLAARVVMRRRREASTTR